MEHFDSFCEAVCRQVRHATPRERRAIRAELAGHLEDRAEILRSRGLEEHQAEEQAVAAMGDPERIGRELNRQYPLGWLILSRTLLVLLAAAVLAFLPASLGTLQSVWERCQVQTAPQSDRSGIEEDVVAAWEVDFQADIGDSGVVRAFEVALTAPESGGYFAYVTFCMYSRNLLAPSPAPYVRNEVDLYNFRGEALISGNGGGNYMTLKVPVNEGDPYVVLSYDRLGSAFRWEIPLNWEDAA